LEVSRRLGGLSAELQSLANLGAFEAKRGNFQQASSWFREAGDLCTSINFYRQGDRTNLPLLAADKASLHMNLGEYSRARKLLSAASRMNGKDRRSLKAVWIAFRKYELYILTGESKLAERAMESVQTAELLETAFLRVERVILETSTGKFSKRDRLNLLLCSSHCGIDRNHPSAVPSPGRTSCKLYRNDRDRGSERTTERNGKARPKIWVPATGSADSVASRNNRGRGHQQGLQPDEIAPTRDGTRIA